MNTHGDSIRTPENPRSSETHEMLLVNQTKNAFIIDKQPDVFNVTGSFWSSEAERKQLLRGNAFLGRFRSDLVSSARAVIYARNS